MKGSIKKFIVVVLSMVLSVSLTNVMLPAENNVAVVEAASKKPKLNKSKVTLTKGETVQLKLSNSKNVKWSSSKKSVATVSKSGKVSAKKKGTAVISAKYKGKTYKCTVTVETPKLNETDLVLEEGEKYTLRVSGTKQKVTWSSSNKKVATVKNGVVTAKSLGNAKITAKVGTKKYVCSVTVEEKEIPIKSITLDKSCMIIDVGANDTLQATILPSDTTEDKEIIWSSSDDTVATVENGIVTGVASGTATISAEVGDVEATCEVQVNQTYGSVSGNVTWFYNKYRGNVSDTGAIVILVPTDGSALNAPDMDSYVCWDIPSIINEDYNKYRIYATKVDGTGAYTIQNVPTGEYKIYIKSDKTTSGTAFNSRDNYILGIQNNMKGLLSVNNGKMLGECAGYNKYYTEIITINKNQNTVYSHDFGTTYV